MISEGASADSMNLLRSCDMRYVGQAYEVNIPFSNPSRSIDKETIENLRKLFHRSHRKRFGHSADQEAVEFVCFRVLGILAVKEIKFPAKGSSEKSALKEHREVYFGEDDGFVNSPIYERERMNPGDRIAGPAIIEDPATTIVVYPKIRAEIDAMGNVVLLSS